GARRTDHEDVVAAAGGDLKRAFRNVLAADVAKVWHVLDRFFEQGARLNVERFGFHRAVCGGVEELANFNQRADRIDIHSFDDCCFARVRRRHDEVADAGVFGGDGDGKHALDGAEDAVEAELADEDEVADVADGEAAVGAEDADGYGEIEARTLFLEVGGREIYGDGCGGEGEAGAFDCREGAV